MPHEIEQQAVYILNRRVYQEASLILDIFSMQHGRLSVIAKGAMKSKKQWSALLQVFQPLHLSWLGRSSLKTLKSVEAPRKALSLVSDRLYCAYYLNELVLNLLPECEPNSEIFALYVAALQGLEDGNKIEPVLRSFEFQLLSRLGFAPDFLMDNLHQPIQTDCFYRYDSRNGFGKLDIVLHSNYISHPLEFLGKHLLFIGRGQFSLLGSDSDGERSENTELRYLNFLNVAKRLMRVLVDHALEGKELKSRTLFSQLKQQRTHYEQD